MQIMTIVAALVVLALALVLILRELRRGSDASAATRSSSTVPPVAARASVPASVPPPRVVDDGGDDADLTRFGARGGGSELPRLGNDTDGDLDDSTGDSTAMTIFEEGAEVDEPTGPIDLILLSAAAQSDVGQRRKRNEDAFLLDDERSLFIVADGMGGYAGGDVASHLATETIARTIQQQVPLSHPSPRRPRVANELVAAIEAANDAIFRQAQGNPELHGMGTTIVAASFPRRKRRGYIAYAGDSRCYRLRESELKQLTADHTFAAKGIGGPLGDQIRRAVGVRPTIKVDLVVDLPRAGDVYLLCSDGLNKMVGDEELRQLVIAHREDLPACARRLVRRANEAGGRDNVTVVVVGVRESAESNVSSSRRSHSLSS